MFEKQSYVMRISVGKTLLISCCPLLKSILYSHSLGVFMVSEQIITKLLCDETYFKIG